MPSSVISVTTTPQRINARGAGVIILKNDGVNNVFFDINSDVQVNGGAYVANGETLSIDAGSNGIEVETLSLVCSSGAGNLVRLWWYS